MSKEYVKLVIFTPETHASIVREALAKAGAGRIGNYSDCSFSTKGSGRFRPLSGATPAIGNVGSLENVAEERIETLCEKALVGSVIKQVRTVHPYEEMAYDVYPLLTDFS